MKNFDWEEFKKGNIAVHCNILEKAKDFLRECYNRGMFWRGGYNLLINNYWDVYEKNTCYVQRNDGLTYISLDYYESKKIINWEIEEESKEVKTQNEQKNNYIIYGQNNLFLELNESQVKLLNLLIEESVIDNNDIIKVDNIEYKTI